MKTYETKDLGLATYLYTKDYQLGNSTKDRKLTIFEFKETGDIPIADAVKDYFGSAHVGAIKYWTNLKILKNIIHEGV